MQITNPNLVYTIICESITGQRLSPTSAALFLDAFFKKKDRASLLLSLQTKSRRERDVEVQRLNAKAEASRIRLILIDELDALVTSKQTLLYNLFDWPCHQNSRLLVISIANTMDLPERLQEKIRSRMGKNRLVYDPYTKNQILEILLSRLAEVQQDKEETIKDNVFNKSSLNYVATKIGNYSGDIRRVLMITRRAVEHARDRYLLLAKDNPKQPIVQVDANMANAAFEELYRAKTVQVLKQLCRDEVLLLLALYLTLQTK